MRIFPSHSNEHIIGDYPLTRVNIRRSILSIAAMTIVMLLSASFGYRDIRMDSTFATKENFNAYNQEYYNLHSKYPLAKGFLPSKYYPIGGPVISILVAKRQQDIDEVQVALRSLAFLKGDKDPEHPAPVLIFNEGDLPQNAIKSIIGSTNRPIGFPLVDFNSFPEGFDPNNARPEFVVEDRNPWGYYQMIRFWLTTIWKHPAIQRFDTIMRIDSDSCFKEINEYLPNFMYENLDYHSQYVGVTSPKGTAFIEGMFDAVNNWWNAHYGDPENPLMFHYAKMSWETQRTLPLFRTNFELSRRSFMQRKDVTQFHEQITENRPFPLFKHRWGDAVLRYLLVALFLPAKRIIIERADGYYHKPQYGCTKEKVEEAMRNNGLL